MRYKILLLIVGLVLSLGFVYGIYELNKYESCKDLVDIQYNEGPCRDGHIAGDSYYLDPLIGQPDYCELEYPTCKLF